MQTRALLNLDKRYCKIFLRAKQLPVKGLTDNRRHALEAVPERRAIHRSAIYQLAPPTLVNVVNNPTLSTILNMADSVASSVSKNFSLLEHIPNSISVDFLPNSQDISSKYLDKGLNYYPPPMK